jgi:hypothetical protein
MLCERKVFAVVSITVVCNFGLRLARSERKIEMRRMPKAQIRQLAKKKNDCEYFEIST